MSTTAGEARATYAIEGESGAGASRPLLELVGEAERSHDAPPRVGLVGDRLFVRDGRGCIVPVPLSRVRRLEAQDDYVGVVTSDHYYLMSARLRDLAEWLPGSFLRVHRSHVVNLDYVERFVPYDAKRLEVRLRDGTRILASRAATETIRRWAR